MEVLQSLSAGCTAQGEAVKWIQVSFMKVVSVFLTASSGKCLVAISIKHIIGHFCLHHQKSKMSPLYMDIFSFKVFILQYSLIKVADIAVSCLALV